MFKKTKKALAILLVIVFTIPMLVQFFDISFHHHDSNICRAKGEQHLHQAHEKCEIQSFVFTSFISNEFNTINTFQIATYKKIFNLVKNQNYHFLKHTFSLRAPPIN